MSNIITAGNGSNSGTSISSDTSGILEIKTGSGPTTAITVGTDQSVTFAGAVSSSGNQTVTGNQSVTGNLTVNGNTTLGDASTDTILMNAAPSIGGAGLGMGMGFRNRIINGAMMIDQRNAGASVTPADTAYTLDRWNAGLTQASKFSVQRSTTAPAGYTNSLLVTSLSAYSVGAGDLFRISQYVEGFNAADLGWGAAGAQSVTLSFWVRSSLTGTFSGSLANSAFNRSYPFTYTVSAANTWEQKTVNIAGDTSGTWLTDSGIGIRVNFSLGAGSSYSGTAGAWAATTLTAATGATSVVGTNGATFYITGVQLEKGSTATSFDYRPYGTELALCQRYYWKTYEQSVVPGTVTQVGATMICVPFVGNSVRYATKNPVPMRAGPTLTYYNPETGVAGYAAYEGSGATNQLTMNTTFIGQSGATTYNTTAGFVGSLYWQTTGSAEL